MHEVLPRGMYKRYPDDEPESSWRNIRMSDSEGIRGYLYVRTMLTCSPEISVMVLHLLLEESELTLDDGRDGGVQDTMAVDTRSCLVERDFRREDQDDDIDWAVSVVRR